MRIFTKNKKKKKSIDPIDGARRTGPASCQIGWVSPRYSESRFVKLDPQRLEDNRAVCLFPGAAETDQYRVLRTQIRHRTKKKGWNTVMITSANPGEGKTLTSINLAFSFAREFDQTVLLVDSDLKRQSIHKRLGYASELGLSDYLLNDRPMKDLIVWPGIEKLTIISGGRTILDSTELLGSPRMKALVEEMKSRYHNRCIIFDTPPVLSRSDAVAFSPLIDCIVMVVEAGMTTIEDVQKALELLPKEKFLGFVLNRAKMELNGYQSAGAD